MDVMDEEKRIIIRTDGVTVSGHLFDNETGQAIRSILPITGGVNRWGDEIYFRIPLELNLAQDARDIVRMGELGYWPEGNSFCIFFGKTPVSHGDEIRAASKVNIFGKVHGDPTVLKVVVDGEQISVTEG